MNNDALVQRIMAEIRKDSFRPIDDDGHVAYLENIEAALRAALAAQGEAVAQAYTLSRDYSKLFQFLLANGKAAGFVRTGDFHDGDVVGITRVRPWTILIGVRGFSFANVFPFNEEDGRTEEAEFIKACEFAKLEWIEPTAPIAPSGSAVALPYLCNGTRFKVAACSSTTPVVGISGLPAELTGRWVALVAADDDCHLAHPAPSPAEPAVPLRAVLAFVDAIAINDKGLRCEYVESRSGSMVKVPDFHALAALLPAAPGEKT